MKNTLNHLQNHLFELIEKLNDDDLTGEALDTEIKRAMVVNDLAKTAIKKEFSTLFLIGVGVKAPVLPVVLN